AHRLGRPETVNGVRPQFPAADDAFEQILRVFVKLARLARPGRRIVEDAREDAFQLPGVKERRPIDERDDLFERIVFEQPDASELGPRDLGRSPVDRRAVGASLIESKRPLLLSARLEKLAVALLLALVLQGE